MKSGYIYVLKHPSDPDLYKIGITTRTPLERLAQHNSDHSQLAGCIVKETGQMWELKEYHPVPDPYYSESVFWGNTKFVDIPYRRGIEIEKMSWAEVEQALAAAKNAGIRPPPPEQPDHVYANTAKIRKRLAGRSIALLGYVQSIVSGKSDFRCINGHEWRTTPRLVGEGEGCPECGIGEREPQEVDKIVNAGVICLLTHANKPGYIKIGIANCALRDIPAGGLWDDWKIHQYRNVDDMELAEKKIWDLLGKPLPPYHEPIQKELDTAENAFRKLTYVLQDELANEERRRERYEDLPPPE